MLGESKVRDLEVALGIKQNILWLQIAVNDFVEMQAPDGLNKLGSVKTRPFLVELLVRTQVVKELSTVAEVHDEVEFGVSLECVVELDDEWAYDLLKDMALGWQ